MNTRNRLSGTARAAEATAEAYAAARYILRLYIIGASPRSIRAVVNTRRICEQHLSGRYDLEIVDVQDDPQAIKDAQIFAAPTLIKLHPLPMQRFMGDMSRPERLLMSFGHMTAPAAAVPPSNV